MITQIVSSFILWFINCDIRSIYIFLITLSWNTLRDECIHRRSYFKIWMCVNSVFCIKSKYDNCVAIKCIHIPILRNKCFKNNEYITKKSKFVILHILTFWRNDIIRTTGKCHKPIFVSRWGSSVIQRITYA